MFFQLILDGLLSDSSSDKRICLGRDISGIRERCPAHWRWWKDMMVSMIAIFAGRTSLLVILYCHVFHRIWLSFIWWNNSSLGMSFRQSTHVTRVYRRVEITTARRAMSLAGLPRTLLNRFPYALWTSLILLSTLFSTDSFEFVRYQGMEIVL